MNYYKDLLNLHIQLSLHCKINYLNDLRLNIDKQ